MGSIVDHLYQDDIITTELKEELGSKSKMDKPELLLNFIRERPAEQIQRFVDLLKLENKHLYDEFVKMKKKFEEYAAALEQSAEIPAAQSCPVSSSLFTGARYPPSQSPVGLPIPSTDSHEETLRKTEPFEEKFKKAEPFEETLRKTEPFEEKFKKAEPFEGTHKRADELSYVTQQISQVSLGGTLGRVPENRDQTQPPSLTLGWDGADGSDAASESVERGADSDQQRDVSNTSGNASLKFFFQSGIIFVRGHPWSRRTCSSLLYIPLNVKYNKFKGMLMKIINDEMNQDMTWELPHDQQ
ncbi:hypothetical protein CAPTEDRAFT_227352 [Capitella teleta]|uniref:CARD domain-containing protein n=1 Tax=Capitella teleta TaxID=283909 RepID=R7V2U3_CAPTE|nr:hypothetical protein CAPTEDRAFT_227352 [Capitella teleta]|eukprot:ELU13158.1 hypothetical protein CAPTEDRAFT_227352 [Capitella teleta]